MERLEANIEIYSRNTRLWTIFSKKACKKPLKVYVDADWANNKDQKSVTGYLIQVYGSTVAWTSKKQATIALSSTESEYVALATVAAEILWFKKLMYDFGINTKGSITVFEDNQSCIHLLKKWERSRLKHIDVKYNFVRELCTDGQLKVMYVPTEDSQVADILNKVDLVNVLSSCGHY